MTKPLRGIDLHYFSGGEKVLGRNPNMEGDCSVLWGDCSGLRGDCSGLTGDCTGISGDLSLIPFKGRGGGQLLCHWAEEIKTTDN